MYQSVASIKPRLDLVLPTFLLAYMRSQPLQIIFASMGKGNAIAHLQITELAELPITLPPLDTRRTFAGRVAEIDKLKAHHRAHLAKLDALFAALQNRAFRVELTGARASEKLFACPAR